MEGLIQYPKVFDYQLIPETGDWAVFPVSSPDATPVIIITEANKMAAADAAHLLNAACADLARILGQEVVKLQTITKRA